MKNRIHIALTTAAIFGMVSTAAFGYALLSPARRWFNADTPRQVNVDNRGVASVIGGDPDHGVTASVNAIKTWNSGGLNVTTSSSATVAYRQGDGISDVVFGDPLRICTGTCLAATLTGYYSTSITGTCGGLTVDKITDADVAFNLSYNYTTPAQGSCSSEIYLDSVVAHEVGHVIGLAHSGTSSALMYPTVAYCSDKQVATDDINGRNASTTARWSRAAGGAAPRREPSARSTATAARTAARERPAPRPAADSIVTASERRGGLRAAPFSWGERSVVVPRHQDVDPLPAHQIDEPVLLGDAARPAPLHVEAQRLGLADPHERFTKHVLDEQQDAKGDGAVGADPVLEILPKLGVEDGESFAAGSLRLSCLQVRGSGAARGAMTEPACRRARA
jgi:hypothetical protein